MRFAAPQPGFSRTAERPAQVVITRHTADVGTRFAARLRQAEGNGTYGFSIA